MVDNQGCIYKEGMHGPTTGQIQKRLKELGFYKYAVDGEYGPYTTLAVKDYQKSIGMKQYGCVGNNTIKKLFPNGIPVTPKPTPVVTSKRCSALTTFIKQPNNWTCGVTCLRMVGSRHGQIPDYQDVVNMAGSNPNNGTGHAGMKAVLKSKLMNFSYAESFYRKDMSLDEVRKKVEEGYDVFINLMTGGLSGWSRSWPHWVLLQCIDDSYCWIDDPDRGASIRHDRYTIEDCVDKNSNPDFIIAKK